MDEKILEGVLDEFKLLAAIPRQSKHEEQVADFLEKYLRELGFQVEQDASKNIIAEVPATPSKENSPRTILQAHMDMVCVAEEGVPYNPLTDPIKLIRTENFLEAEGTSLGADDGIGVAEILYLAKRHEKFSHGAIRIIFTSDEEQGMSGAIGLDEKFLRDATFMINCDSEDFDELVVGSAGNVHIDFSRKINFVTPEENLGNSFRVKLGGLRGGHSGTEISANRANAIKLMKDFLRSVEEVGEIRLAKFFGGEAPNVIPNSAEVLIVTGLDEKVLQACAEKFSSRVEKIFMDGEPNFKIEISPAERPQKVFSAEDFSDSMNLLTLIHSGVFSMNREIPDLVETSSNLGIIRTEEKFLRLSLLPRSNISELLENFIEIYSALAKVTNFEIKYSQPSPAWNFNPKSRLTKIMAEIFERQNNFSPKVHTIHAGLECSFFLEKNPELDVVSIGTTNENIHSPKERLHLKTIAPQVNWILATLEKISDEAR